MPFDPSKPFEIEGAATPAAPSSSTKTSTFDPSKPFTVEDEKPTSQEPSTGQIIGSGLVSKGGAGTLGAPVDIGTGFVNAVAEQVRGLPHIVKPLVGAETFEEAQKHRKEISETPLINPADVPGGSAWWEKRAADAGLPTVSTVHPSTTAGKVLQSSVGTAAGFAAPGTIAKIPGMGAVGALMPGNPIVNVGIGAVAGAAGEGAAELAPVNLKEPAKELGTLIGGAAASTVPAAVSGVGRAGQAAYNAMPPLTAGSRAEAARVGAVRQLEAQATNPDAAFKALNDRLAADQAELVPGSKPTTGELANDPGLLGLQNVRAKQNHDLGDEITLRRVANNKARVQAMQQMVAPNAWPEATQAFLRSHLQGIDLAGEEAAETARQGAERLRSFVAPTSTPEEQGAAARTSIEAQRAPEEQLLVTQQKAVEQEAANAQGQFGGTEALGTPEQRQAAVAGYGSAMREPAQAAYDAERKRLTELREAIDPSGTMGMSPDAIKAARANIFETFTPESGTMFSGPESHLYDTVKNWGALIPIDQAMQLRANINARLKNVIDHSPQEAKRLMMLKSGIDDALSDTAAHVQAVERAAGMEQQAGIGSRLVDATLPELEQAHLGTRFSSLLQAARGEEDVAGQNPLGHPGSDKASQALIAATERGIPTATGATGEVEGRPQNAPGGEGVPTTLGERGGAQPALGVSNAPAEGGVRQGPLEPLTQEAREKFANWNQAYAEMARQFRGETPGKLHAVGKILQRGGAYDSYKLTDQEVPWAVIGKGPTSGDAVQRFLAATPPEAHAALDDAFAFSLRSAAQNPETGALNLTKYRQWIRDHEAALSQRPELLDKFNTVAAAQQRLQEINQAIADHAATHPLRPGWSDSAILPQFWRQGSAGRDSMQEFFRVAGSGEDAVRAAVDHAAFSFVNATVRDGKIDPKLAGTWLRQHDQALSTMPGLKDHFANAKEAQELVDQTVAMHMQARKEFTQSIAGAFIQDDPDKAISRLFTGGDRTQKAQDLMNRVKSDKAATEGIQRAAIDHILSRFSGAPMAGAEEGTLTPQRLQDFIAENRQVLNTIFGPPTAKNFDALAEDLQRSQRAVGAKQPGGSDTKELQERGRPFEEAKEPKTLPSIALALLAEHAGTHLVGGPAGPIAAGATLIARPWLRGKANELKLETTKVLDQMLLDPEFAVRMRNLYPPGSDVPKASVLKLLGSRAIMQTLNAARGDDLTPDRQGHKSGGRITFQSGGGVFSEDPHGFAAWHGKSTEEQAGHFADLARRFGIEAKTAKEAAAQQEDLQMQRMEQARQPAP